MPAIIALRSAAHQPVCGRSLLRGVPRSARTEMSCSSGAAFDGSSDRRRAQRRSLYRRRRALPRRATVRHGPPHWRVRPPPASSATRSPREVCAFLPPPRSILAGLATIGCRARGHGGNSRTRGQMRRPAVRHLRGPSNLPRGHVARPGPLRSGSAARAATARSRPTSATGGAYIARAAENSRSCDRPIGTAPFPNCASSRTACEERKQNEWRGVAGTPRRQQRRNIPSCSSGHSGEALLDSRIDGANQEQVAVADQPHRAVGERPTGTWRQSTADRLG